MTGRTWCPERMKWEGSACSEDQTGPLPSLCHPPTHLHPHQGQRLLCKAAVRGTCSGAVAAVYKGKGLYLSLESNTICGWWPQAGISICIFLGRSGEKRRVLPKVMKTSGPPEVLVIKSPM